MGGRDSVVDIATSYGLDGPGIESRWERYFPCPPERSRWQSSLCVIGTGAFPLRWLEPSADRPPSFSSRLRMGRVYTSTYLCPHRHVMGWTYTHSARLHNLHTSPNIRMIRWSWHGQGMQDEGDRREMLTTFCRRIRKTDHLEDIVLV
jgi:hypothetical protein